MRFLLISVSDPSDASRANLDALIQSVAGQDEDVDLVIVQRGGGPPVAALPDSRVRVHAVEQPLATGLSAARNAAFAFAGDRGLLEAADAVGFPDDDCTLDVGLLGRVERRLDGLGLVAGPYAPAPESIDWGRFPRDEREITPRLCMKAVSSINVFLSAAAVRAIGPFDERFGLGAEYGASEDADYVLRALGAGYRGRWVPDDVLLLHEYKPGVPSRYYLGNVAVLAKHAFGRPRTVWLLARCFAYGLKLLARRAITLRDYGRGLVVAARVVRSEASRLPGPEGA